MMIDNRNSKLLNFVQKGLVKIKKQFDIVSQLLNSNNNRKVHLVKPFSGSVLEGIKQTLNLNETSTASEVLTKLVGSMNDVSTLIVDNKIYTEKVVKDEIQSNIRALFLDGLSNIKETSTFIDTVYNTSVRDIEQSNLELYTELRDLMELQKKVNAFISMNAASLTKAKTSIQNELVTINSLIKLEINNELLITVINNLLKLVNRISNMTSSSQMSLDITDLIDKIDVISEDVYALLYSYVKENHNNDCWIVIEQKDNLMFDCYEMIKITNTDKSVGELTKYFVSFTASPILEISDDLLNELIKGHRNNFKNMEILISDGYTKPEVVNDILLKYQILDALYTYKTKK